jgi:MFS family permease
MPVKTQPWWRSLTRDHWQVFALASLAWLFDCLCQQAFNLSRDGAMADLLTDKTRATEYASYTTSVFLIGWAIGGFIFGALGDRHGRARMLTVSVFLYSVGTGLSAFTAGYAGFCASLFFTGLGVGGIFGLAVALVADTVADTARAPALGLLQSLSTWGNIVGGMIGMGIGAAAAHRLLPFGLRAWQSMFLVGSLPALVCAFALMRLKEPARWVQARTEGIEKGVKFGSYGKLLRHPTWSRHAWFGLIFCCSGIIGLWGLGNFHPAIVGSIVVAHYAGAHLAANELAGKLATWRALGLLMQNIGAFCGMIALARFAQTKGRRPALALGLALSFLSTVLVFKSLRQFDQIFWMLPIMGFGQYGVFAVYAIYLPELFPTSLRSTGTSFCYNFGRLAAATAPFTLGRITRRLGGDIEGFRTAGLWMSLVLLVGIAVIPFLPETKGQPLPEE